MMMEGVRQRQKEERMTLKNQLWKSGVWCCHDGVHNAERGCGQVWDEKECINHPSKAAQKAVMIQNQG